jgi:peptidoglycan-associated lipoprotein
MGALVVTTALAACSGPSETVVDDEIYGGHQDSAAASGMDDGSIQEGSVFDDVLAGRRADITLDERVVYFDFDNSEVKSSFRELLKGHGRYLAANPDIQVRLEGHADERGSREYNVGLGEQRAQAVRQILLLQGVSTPQLATVSFGEERPAVPDSGEEAWSLNRRVELIYLPPQQLGQQNTW